MMAFAKLALVLLALAPTSLGASVQERTTPSAAAAVNTTTCGGKTFVYEELSGFGYLASDARDSTGDTIGGIGSSLALADWCRRGDQYTATLYGLPDRGWNTNGSVNTVPRVQVFDLTFTPQPAASTAKPSGPNIKIVYQRTILLTGPDGTYMTGLDPNGTLSYDGFPVLPASQFSGDGYGGPGAGGKRISLDAEGLFLGRDSSFWISDEYGPYVYQFDSKGKMIAAIQPPDAFLPVRKGVINFSSDSPPAYSPDAHPTPKSPTQGRQNNQGFEGLTVSPDGKFLYVLIQSALQQEGGSDTTTRREARFLKYSLYGKQKRWADDKPGRKATPVLEAEYVVPLPTFTNAAGKKRVAAQSEIHYVSETQFFVLPRDSSVGRGQSDPTSVYRHIDLFDISNATNIKGTYDAFNSSITGNSTSDVLKYGITPAKLCLFIDFNVNSQLNKFAYSNGDVVHNGAPVNLGLLNEKWESIGIVPVNEERDGSDPQDEYYVFSMSDNDFITDNGYIDFGKIHYVDGSATVPFLDTQMLVFKIKLPPGTKPLLS